MLYTHAIKGIHDSNHLLAICLHAHSKLVSIAEYSYIPEYPKKPKCVLGVQMNRMTPQFGDTRGSRLEGVASKSHADPANILCPAFHSNSSDRNAQQLCDKVIEYAPNIACPCSNNDNGSNDNRMPFNDKQKENNVTTAAYGNKDVDDHSDDDEYEGEFENDLMPGTLKNGADYEPISVLAEGWVHVKGTGNDWFGSRGWKARYVKLVVSFGSRISFVRME